MEHTNYLYGIGFVPVHDQVRIHKKKPMSPVSQVFSQVAHPGPLRQLSYGRLKSGEYPVRGFEIVIRQVIPYFFEIMGRYARVRTNVFMSAVMSIIDNYC